MRHICNAPLPPARRPACRKIACKHGSLTAIAGAKFPPSPTVDFAAPEINSGVWLFRTRGPALRPVCVSGHDGGTVRQATNPPSHWRGTFAPQHRWLDRRAADDGDEAVKLPDCLIGGVGEGPVLRRPFSLPSDAAQTALTVGAGCIFAKQSAEDLGAKAGNLRAASPLAHRVDLH